MGARVIVAAVAAAVAAGCGGSGTGVVDLDGRAVEPVAGGAPVALVFVEPTCPISNRYAPEIARLAAEWGARGVRFWLVYAGPEAAGAGAAEAIRAHVAEYGLEGVPAVRDPRRALVARAGARVTPEAALFDGAGRLVYRGRIDDRWVDVTTARPEPTRRELREAIAALLEGRDVPQPGGPAVGCAIPR